MAIRVILTGTSPLLCHNIQLANPDNYWAKQISEITKKRKKTEDDRAEIAKREWFGSLYTHDGKIVMPTANVLKCFIETGKITREGKSVARALSCLDGLHVPLIFGGPKTKEFPDGSSKPEDVWEHEQFRDQTLVGIGRQRVLRTRPIFRVWGLVTTWEVLTQVTDQEAIDKIIAMAGRVEGLGDNRVNGYGRFTAEITNLASELKEAA